MVLFAYDVRTPNARRVLVDSARRGVYGGGGAGGDFACGAIAAGDERSASFDFESAKLVAQRLRVSGVERSLVDVVFVAGDVGVMRSRRVLVDGRAGALVENDRRLLTY